MVHSLLEMNTHCGSVYITSIITNQLVLGDDTTWHTLQDHCRPLPAVPRVRRRASVLHSSSGAVSSFFRIFSTTDDRSASFKDTAASPVCQHREWISLFSKEFTITTEDRSTPVKHTAVFPVCSFIHNHLIDTMRRNL